MATTNSGSFTVARKAVLARADGSVNLRLAYTSVAKGTALVERELEIPADSSKPILDDAGNQITATVPAALANAITAFLAQLDNAIAGGAAAGKLDL